MSRSRSWISRIGAALQLGPTLLAAGIVSGCAIPDTYGFRSVHYNVEAEESKNKTLLLNVIRAAYRKPLQFTDVSSILGQTSGTIKADLALPFAANLVTAARIFSLTPGVSITGGPNFTVNVLNTKEFYQGILSPIPPQTVAYYLQSGIPRPVILMLLVSKIEYGPLADLTAVYSDVASKDGFEHFRELLQVLIDAGLDIEQVGDVAVLGPPLRDVDLRDAKVLQSLDAQGVKVVRHAKTDPNPLIPDAQREAIEGPYYYLLEVNKTSFRVCFDHRSFSTDKLKAYPALVEVLKNEPAVLCQASAEERRRATSKPSAPPVGGASAPTVPLAPSTGDVAPVTPPTKPVTQSPAPPPPPPLNAPNVQALHIASGDLRLSMRSVEGVIYYLGEIVRRELGLDGRPAFTPKIRTVPEADVDTVLFALSRGMTTGPQISVGYDGVDYHLAVDPSAKDRSAQVLELVLQLLAQNNSAKDLPAPSVIPVISR